MPTQQHGTTALRDFWSDYRCKAGGLWADPYFMGKQIGGTPAIMVDAYRALELALASEGYEPPDRGQSVWAYNCRNIASSGKPSLHSYGIAVDIDPAHNPQANIPKYSGWFTEAQVLAAESVQNTLGQRIWWWGGHWSGSTLPDLMHWQVDQPPAGCLVDWSTVPGDEKPEQPEEEDEGMILKEGASGNAVKSAQRALNNWSSWNEKGWTVQVDGTWETDSKMTDRVKEFQKALDLTETGEIDGLTGAYLVGRYDQPKMTD